MLNDRHHILANKHFTACQSEQIATHPRQLIEGIKPFLSGKFRSRAAVSCVVTMHASEVAAIRQLDVHLLNVMVLPIEFIDLLFDTRCHARFELGCHAYFLSWSWSRGRRRRADIRVC